MLHPKFFQACYTAGGTALKCKWSYKFCVKSFTSREVYTYLHVFQDFGCKNNTMRIKAFSLIDILHSFWIGCLLCCITVSAASRRFLGISLVFLKLRIGYFSDTPKLPIIVAECPNIFDVQCIWERIFESLENIFVFKYS